MGQLVFLQLCRPIIPYIILYLYSRNFLNCYNMRITVDPPNSMSNNKKEYYDEKSSAAYGLLIMCLGLDVIEFVESCPETAFAVWNKLHGSSP